MLRHLAVILGLLAGSLAFAATPSVAAGIDVDCGPDAVWSGRLCKVVAVSPGQAAAAKPKAKQKAGSVAPGCVFKGKSVPCQDSELGWWSNARSCYVRLADPQPAASDPVWVGRSGGAVYECNLSFALAGYRFGYVFWSASAPAGPDPVVLARSAVETMRLRPISIGIVPEDVPGSVGLVGMPVWLWADRPDEHSWGPITRTASAGGVSVTATAEVERVRWLMGDGQVVVCSGPGTVYEDRFGKADSPTCGYTYSKQGVYTVRAESLWRVRWSGMGLSGTIPVLLTDSTTITIGELQVITVG